MQHHACARQHARLPTATATATARQPHGHGQNCTRRKAHSAPARRTTASAMRDVGIHFSIHQPPPFRLRPPSAVVRRPSPCSRSPALSLSQLRQEPQVVGSRLSQMFDAVLLVLVLITPPALSPPTHGVYVATHVRCQLSLRLRRRSSLIALALQALGPSACFQVVKLLHCFVVRAKSQI